MKATRYILLAIVSATPIVAWGLASPARLLLPELNDMVCDGPVCVEEPERMAQAIELYRLSLQTLSESGISLETAPTFVYCSSDDCYRSFGGGDERAISYPFLGTVIAPASWQRYITMHELVHWFQFSEVGALSIMLKPEWYREGMAYAYSNAPYTDIPEHYLPMMWQYRQWHADRSWTEVLQITEEL